MCSNFGTCCVGGLVRRGGQRWASGSGNDQKTVVVLLVIVNLNDGIGDTPYMSRFGWSAQLPLGGAKVHKTMRELDARSTIPFIVLPMRLLRHYLQRNLGGKMLQHQNGRERCWLPTRLTRLSSIAHGHERHISRQRMDYPLKAMPYVYNLFNVIFNHICTGLTRAFKLLHSLR